MSFNLDLFYFVNHGMQHPLLDSTVPTISHFGGFIILVITCLILIVYAKVRGRTNLLKISILALIALLFADLIAAILKYMVYEPRPFIALNDVNLLIHEDDPFSFPSGHATSTFAVVTVFILNMKKLFEKHYLAVNIALVVFAILIPFSRVYVGVHYPFDVFSGAVIGLVSGIFVNHFGDEILKKLNY